MYTTSTLLLLIKLLVKHSWVLHCTSKNSSRTSRSRWAGRLDGWVGWHYTSLSTLPPFSLSSISIIEQTKECGCERRELAPHRTAIINNNCHYVWSSQAAEERSLEQPKHFPLTPKQAASSISPQHSTTLQCLYNRKWTNRLCTILSTGEWVLQDFQLSLFHFHFSDFQISTVADACMLICRYVYVCSLSRIRSIDDARSSHGVSITHSRKSSTAADFLLSDRRFRVSTTYAFLVDCVLPARYVLRYIYTYYSISCSTVIIIPQFKSVE